MNKTQISKLQSELEIFFFILSVLYTFEKKILINEYIISL